MSHAASKCSLIPNTSQSYADPKSIGQNHCVEVLGNSEVLHRIMTNLPEPRDLFRRVLTECISSNPDSIRYIVLLMAFYLHVGPFSREVIARIENITR